MIIQVFSIEKLDYLFSLNLCLSSEIKTILTRMYYYVYVSPYLRQKVLNEFGGY